jgi:hypothetical protein
MLLFEIANLKSKVMYKSTPVEEYFNYRRRMRIGNIIQTYATIEGKKYDATWGLINGKIYVKSRQIGWNGRLSNFVSINNKSGMNFDGVEIRGIEGFLQSLKFQDESTQRRICGLIGAKAQQSGQEGNSWKSSQILWWKGKSMKREESEYSSLISRFYDQVYLNNKSNKINLMMSADLDMIHPEGHKPKHDTILTEHEFIGNLKRVRKKLLSGWKIEEREPTEEEMEKFKNSASYGSIQKARSAVEATERRNGIQPGSRGSGHSAEAFLNNAYNRNTKTPAARTPAARTPAARTPAARTPAAPAPEQGGIKAAIQYVKDDLKDGISLKDAIEDAVAEYGVNPRDLNVYFLRRT